MCRRLATQFPHDHLTVHHTCGNGGTCLLSLKSPPPNLDRRLEVAIAPRLVPRRSRVVGSLHQAGWFCSLQAPSSPAPRMTAAPTALPAVAAAQVPPDTAPEALADSAKAARRRAAPVRVARLKAAPVRAARLRAARVKEVRVDQIPEEAVAVAQPPEALRLAAAAAKLAARREALVAAQATQTRSPTARAWCACKAASSWCGIDSPTGTSRAKPPGT